MVHDLHTIIGKAIRESTGIEDAQLVDGGEHADLTTTIAFTLAKLKRQSPVKIAGDLAEQLVKDHELRDISVEGRTRAWFGLPTAFGFRQPHMPAIRCAFCGRCTRRTS